MSWSAILSGTEKRSRRKFLKTSDSPAEITYSWFIVFLREHRHYFKRDFIRDTVWGYLRSLNKHPRKNIVQKALRMILSIIWSSSKILRIKREEKKKATWFEYQRVIIFKEKRRAKSKLKHNKKILKHLKIHNEFPQSGRGSKGSESRLNDVNKIYHSVDNSKIRSEFIWDL